jgi:hypothetical protein
MGKVYKAKHALKTRQGNGNTPSHRPPSPGVERDRKLSLVYEVLGLEVKEEVERHKERARALEGRIRELEHLLQQRDNRIRQLESDLATSEEAFKRRALRTAGIVHGER